MSILSAFSEKTKIDGFNVSYSVDEDGKETIEVVYSGPSGNADFKKVEDWIDSIRNRLNKTQANLRILAQARALKARTKE